MLLYHFTRDAPSEDGEGRRLDAISREGLRPHEDDNSCGKSVVWLTAREDDMEWIGRMTEASSEKVTLMRLTVGLKLGPVSKRRLAHYPTWLRKQRHSNLMTKDGKPVSTDEMYNRFKANDDREGSGFADWYVYFGTILPKHIIDVSPVMLKPANFMTLREVQQVSHEPPAAGEP